MQKYSSTTAAAGASFSALAQDYTNNCLRTADAMLLLIDEATAVPKPTILGVPKSADDLAILATIEATTPVPGFTYVPPPTAVVAVPTSSPSASAGKPGLPSRCTDAASISTAWNADNQVVLNYVQALGNLANVDAIPTPNASPLAAPLEKIGVSAATVQAGSNVLSAITAFFEGQGEERDIRGFLARVNPYLESAIPALLITDAFYSDNLQGEFNTITGDYGVYATSRLQAYRSIDIDRDIATQCKRNQSYAECVAKISMADNQQLNAIMIDLLEKKGAVLGAIDFINGQRRASAAYGSAVEQILSTHETLYKKSLGKATASDYLNIIQSTGAPIITDLTALAKAVK